MKIGNIEVYGIIYKITNKVNNKVYIGQSVNGFDRRYDNNIVKRTCNKHLKNAIDKYGIENFDICKVYDIAFSKEELDIKECVYIELFNCTNRKNGYNIRGGGSKGSTSEETKQILSNLNKGNKHPQWGKHQSEQTIEKRKEKLKGQKRTEESKRKMSENHANVSGKNNPMYGKGDLLKGKNNGRAKSVICITTNMVFDTAIEGAEYYGFKSSSSVRSCCKGRYKSAGKLTDGTPLIWRYLIIIEL